MKPTKVVEFLSIYDYQDDEMMVLNGRNEKISNVMDELYDFYSDLYIDHIKITDGMLSVTAHAVAIYR